MQDSYLPAPIDKILYYLAVLRRALRAIERHGNSGNISGILLSGWLAKAFHMVPAVLWDWDEGSQPSEVEAWVSDGFPAFLAEHDAPKAWLDEAAQISRLDSDHTELYLDGLSDSDDLTLAPVERCVYYLDFISSFLFSATQLRNEQKMPDDVLLLCDDSAENPESALEIAREMSLLASVIVDVPAYLVHWTQFDETMFEERAQKSLTATPGAFDRWVKYHEISRLLKKQREQAADAATG